MRSPKRLAGWTGCGGKLNCGGSISQVSVPVILSWWHKMASNMPPPCKNQDCQRWRSCDNESLDDLGCRGINKGKLPQMK